MSQARGRPRTVAVAPYRGAAHAACLALRRRVHYSQARDGAAGVRRPGLGAGATRGRRRARAASELHLRDPTGIEYEGHRAKAFALAVDGRAGEALALLNDGWSDEWPTPAAYATDVARIHFLAGNCAAALTALQLDLRTLDHLDGVTEFAATCARRDPSVRRQALRVAVRGARGLRKLTAATAVLSARPESPGDAQHDLAELSP